MEDRIASLLESAKENYAECVERIQKLEQQLIGERNNLNQLSGAHAALQALQSPPEDEDAQDDEKGEDD